MEDAIKISTIVALFIANVSGFCLLYSNPFGRVYAIADRIFTKSSIVSVTLLFAMLVLSIVRVL